jgi:hypothetical protein
LELRALRERPCEILKNLVFTVTEFLTIDQLLIELSHPLQVNFSSLLEYLEPVKSFAATVVYIILLRAATCKGRLMFYLLIFQLKVQVPLRSV